MAKKGTLRGRLFCGVSAVTWSQVERERSGSSGEGNYDHRGRDGSDLAQIKSGQLSPEAGRGKEQVSSRASTETVAFPLGPDTDSVRLILAF